MNETLPKGWANASLNDIADWGSGGTPKATEKKYYDGNIPWLIIADLNNAVVTKSNKQITEIGLESSSAKWVEATHSDRLDSSQERIFDQSPARGGDSAAARANKDTSRQSPFWS